MVAKYPLERLGKYMSIQGGYAFRSSDFSNSGIPVLKIKNVRLHNVDFSELEYVSEEVAHSASSYFCKKGDLLISMTGSGPQAPNSVVGRVARFTGPNDQFIINQRVGRFNIHNPNELNSRYLFYVVTQEECQWQLVSQATGSANQVNISATQIENLYIPLPPLFEQRAIAHILGTLDDKIELNRRMNKTLEAMAQALFKSWFVDFEPFRNQGMQDSPLGEIPVGWRVVTVGELGEIVCGKTPPTTDKGNYGGIIPFIAIPDMHENVFVTGTATYLTEKGAATQPKKLLPKLSVCVSCIATPGLVAITSVPSHTNQQINSIICNSAVSPYWCYLSMTGIRQEIITGGAGGSATLNLNKGEFSKLQVVKPDRETMKVFHNLVEPVFSRILSNDSESITLAAIRDALLPKLLSGEIRLRDAKKFVEKAA
jgi:type I restriction enzyme, S subunit